MAIADTQATTRTIWNFDPAHSHIEFSTKHMMVSTVKGHFSGVTGKIVGDLDDPTTAEIDVQIEAATINTRNEQRDAHLRSADFLDSENFPAIEFRSTAIERDGDDEFNVTGDLTIRGVTKPVELKATLNGHGTTPFGTEIVGISVTGKFNRKEYGVNFNVALETGGWLVSDTVKLDLEIEAVKAS